MFTPDHTRSSSEMLRVHYFVEICGRSLTAGEVEAVKATVLAAYRTATQVP